ncbi:MAG: RloB family protein [Saprospiraceae bacterium]
MRVRKSLERKTGFRDGRMIIIATEGSVTEVSYFTQLNDAAILSSNKFQIKVIPPENNRSSPNHVFKSLINFKREYQIKGNDELWMVIDRDRWTVQMLSDIISQCKQKDIGLCISNPCFEIWLILHYEDLSKISSEILDKLLINKKVNGRTESKRYISELMGNKNLNDFTSLFPNLNLAIKNAKLLSVAQNFNIVDHLGSDVHFIFDQKILY